MTLNQLREVANIEKIFIYNKETKQTQEHPEYSVYGVLCKCGNYKVLRVYADNEFSNQSTIDNSISIKPTLKVVIMEDK